MENLSVYIESTIGVCAEFSADGKERSEVSMVISPLRITQEEAVLRVNSGCNMWRACKNKACQFSLASHPDRP